MVPILYKNIDPLFRYRAGNTNELLSLIQALSNRENAEHVCKLRMGGKSNVLLGFLDKPIGPAMVDDVAPKDDMGALVIKMFHKLVVGALQNCSKLQEFRCGQLRHTGTWC